MHRHGDHPDERDDGPAHADAGDNAKDEVHQAQRSLGVVDRVDGLRRCARLRCGVAVRMSLAMRLPFGFGFPPGRDYSHKPIR